jgi:hypothetical protein
MSKTYHRPPQPDEGNWPGNVRPLRQRQVEIDPTKFRERITEEPITKLGRTVRRWSPAMRRLLKLSFASLIIIISVIILWTQVLVPGWYWLQTRWQYGATPITQMDANVGHGGESHFLAEYYKGAIVIIEIPYANTNDTHTYTIPGITSNGETPVVLLSTVRDGNTGRLDLVIQIADTNFETVLYNTGSSFSENQ